jgi:site-specific recombinase XerD
LDDLQSYIRDYLVWMQENDYRYSVVTTYRGALNQFERFVRRHAISPDRVFTHDTLCAFGKSPHHFTAVRGLSRYLCQKQIIPAPITKPVTRLPDIYEAYLAYYEKSRGVGRSSMQCAQSVLSGLCQYLEQEHIDLCHLTIAQTDMFLTQHNARFQSATRRYNRSALRGFLRYLYQMQAIKRNLAPLIVAAPIYGLAKPPRFLQPDEITRLFSSLDSTTPQGLRTAALVHIGYTLGLRPKEISQISLDDVSFAKGLINIHQRKCDNPVHIPLPEITIKAIAAYIVGARPKSHHRRLFLTFTAPYRPIRAATVCMAIGSQIHRINPAASAYALRHTYAQNLLESGASVFEIKEMLGHDNIQSSSRYLHIHTKLMQRTLFDDTL